MREVIIGLIRRVIQKKYGPVIYSVMGSNHFPTKHYPKGYGYIVTLLDIPKDIRIQISNDMRMLLQMLGLKNVQMISSNDVIEVFGLEQSEI